MNRKSLTICLILAIAAMRLSQSVWADDKSAHEDELMIAAQKICPVSGEALGEMGAPFKTQIGDQTFFLCCKDCVGKPIPKENLEKVTANLMAAQGVCPVSGKPLPKDAPSVIVDHRQVFACCKMCPAKIQADPAKYIAKVDELIEKNLRDQQEKKQ
jgi:hypothetical protein